MTNLELEEQILSNELRKTCNAKGQEMFPEQSAYILCELGLLYKMKSPDKISLIQSAALINAAIVRKPTEEKFHAELQLLCEHVLSCANAEKQNSNLVEISNHTKEMVTKMRLKTKSSLKNIKRIPESTEDESKILKLEKTKIEQVKALQTEIAQQYTCIMEFLSSCCIDIMGSPPCKFALVGMGSLARKETTPYSDFDHVVLLEEHFHKWINAEDNYEYFRWYSVIFHIIVIILQETIISSVCIPSLNDTEKSFGDWFYDLFTTRGISFDGMMPHACKFPLGRTRATAKKPYKTELIKPVSEMVKYLSFDEDIKNGYKLADILTRTCFVAGDEDLYQLFLRKVFKTQKVNYIVTSSQILSQLKEDMENFDILKSLNEFQLSKSWNMKRVIYRSTSLFVSALGRLHGSQNNSNFGIIVDFRKRGIIDDSTAHRLSLMVAVACHIRLHTYMTKQTQNDMVASDQNSFFEKSTPLYISKIISKKDLIKYFCDVSLLQAYFRFSQEYKCLNDLYQKSTLWHSLVIKIKFNLFEEVIEEGESHLKNCRILSHNDLMVMFYVALAHQNLNHTRKSLNQLEKIEQHAAFSNLPTSIKSRLYFSMFDLKCSVGQCRQVIDDITYITKTRKFENVFHFYMIKGFAFLYLQQYNQALSSYRDFLREAKFNSSFLTFYSRNQSFLFILRAIVICLLNIGHPNRALNHAFELLEASTNLGSTNFTSLCYDLIELCYLKLNCMVQSEVYFGKRKKYQMLCGQPFESND